MSTEALAVYLGKTAARRIAAEGWNPDLFSLMIGASGGPKWLILSHLDRLLFGQFLAAGGQPLSVLGSSIGSWRHACLATRDPVATIAQLETDYLSQAYSARPGPEEVSSISLQLLERALGDTGIDDILQHPRFHTHIVTARGRGLTGSGSGAALATGMGTAALGNAVSRKLLDRQFQRVVFHTGHQPSPGLALDDFETVFCQLNRENLRAALHASGSIPFVLTGEKDIDGAPPGQYWDGGILDYHFDLSRYPGDGLILYPHFSERIITGWFDKFLPWRRPPIQQFDKLVLLCPSKTFIASLPLAKIPDRSDFSRMKPAQRVRYWQQCVTKSKDLAEAFGDMVNSGDPLRGATVLA